MTLNFKTNISISSDKYIDSIMNSIKIDNDFYPENPTQTKITKKQNKIDVKITSTHLPHFRANINTILRLAQVSHDSIKAIESNS